MTKDACLTCPACVQHTFSISRCRWESPDPRVKSGGYKGCLQKPFINGSQDQPSLRPKDWAAHTHGHTEASSREYPHQVR